MVHSVKIQWPRLVQVALIVLLHVSYALPSSVRNNVESLETAPTAGPTTSLQSQSSNLIMSDTSNTPTMAPTTEVAEDVLAVIPTVSPTASSTTAQPNNPNAPQLPLGDMNVVVLTDVHSWLAGHGAKERSLNADYGDILSFVQRLKAYVAQHEPDKDIWFVMNGDWIDGTGLAVNGDVSHLVPLIEKMPYDAINVGNHELYEDSVIDYITRPGGFVHWWGDRYLTSNILMSASRQPLGSRYKVLRGKNSNLLTFGFLFNMQDHASLVTVQEVGAVVSEKWFSKALKEEDYDAILVLAHMGVRDPLLQAILSKIRSIVGDSVPVQFLTGHTHYRDVAVVDAASTSVEAGRFLDTVGFVSFPKASSLQTSQSGNTNFTHLFRHVFLDASVDNLRQTVRAEKLGTTDGAALSAFIDRTRNDLGLLENIGCLNADLFLENGLTKADSLWRYFRDRVVPGEFGASDVLLMGKGMWRYDLYSGNILLDDVIAVSPFNETFVLWPDVPGELIMELNLTANNVSHSNPYNPPFMPELPEFVLCPTGTIEPNEQMYNLITSVFEANQIKELLQLLDPQFSDRQPMNLNITTTQLWIQHFREARHFLGCSSLGRHHGNGKNDAGNFFGVASEQERDMMWMFFLLLAVVCVLALSIWHIRLRGIIHRRITFQRDSVIIEAQREYEDAHGMCYRDRDVSEDEDEFI